MNEPFRHSDVHRHTADDDRELRPERPVFDDRLLAKYERLIHHVIHKIGFVYFGERHGMTTEDALQAGRVGLWQATIDFDPERASPRARNPFAYFAIKKIHDEIFNEFRRCQWTKWSKGHGTPDFVEIDENYLGAAKNDVEREVAALEEWQRVERTVRTLKPAYRQIFQGVMIHDGHGKAGPGGAFQRNVGLTHQTISDKRRRIRKRIKERLH